MNWWMLTGAAMAMFCAVGHAIVGGDRFYRPIRSALPDEVLAGLFAGMWHLITVHFVLSAILLGALSIGRFSNEAAAWFIAAQFAGYAAVYFAISLRLGGALKLFQWIPFGATAILGALGAINTP
jgi:hypothetical protein